MKRLATLVMAASIAAGALAASGPAGDTAPLGRRYHARGDGWRLTVSSDDVTLVEKLGPMRWNWYGGPPRRIGSEGLSFEGELMFTEVVANEADTQFRSYRLEIVREMCRDDKGHMHQTTVTISFDGAEADHGCGGAIPAE